MTHVYNKIADKRSISYHNSVFIPTNTNNDSSEKEETKGKITRIEYSRKHSIPKYNISNTNNRNNTNYTKTKIMQEDEIKEKERIQPMFMNFLKFITSPILFSMIVLFTTK